MEKYFASPQTFDAHLRGTATFFSRTYFRWTLFRFPLSCSETFSISTGPVKRAPTNMEHWQKVLIGTLGGFVATIIFYLVMGKLLDYFYIRRKTRRSSGAVAQPQRVYGKKKGPVMVIVIMCNARTAKESPLVFGSRPLGLVPG